MSQNVHSLRPDQNGQVFSSGSRNALSYRWWLAAGRGAALGAVLLWCAGGLAAPVQAAGETASGQTLMQIQSPALQAAQTGGSGSGAVPTAAAPRPAESGPLRASAVRVSAHDGITRVVVDLSGPLTVTLGKGQEDKVVLDLPELDWQPDAASLPKSIGLLRDLAYKSRGAGLGRLDLNLTSAGTIFKLFTLPPVNNGPTRLVVDLVSGEPAPPPPAGPKPSSVPAADSSEAAPPSPPPARMEKPASPLAKATASMEKPVVMLDAGHGGNDPGATSLSGAHEKVITLALAKAISDKLEAGGKVTPRLTRDSDFFIPLRERVAIARAAHADLFISIHADSVDESYIHGLSVYTLSRTASSAQAQALAEKENKADIVSGIDLSHESPEVTNILIDLVQRESMNQSAVLADKVIAEVRKAMPLLDNTHRFAGFAVLKAPDIPSVLIESGYLSNRQDEKFLRSPEGRDKLATAIARAVEAYFAGLPKRGHVR